MTHFFLHNSFRNGDVILTRCLIEAVRSSFPDVEITLECVEECAYLWEDLELPVVKYQGRQYKDLSPSPNCPKNALFVNIAFGVFEDILALYGISYQNNVLTFNRQLFNYKLHPLYCLPAASTTPRIAFFGGGEVHIEVKPNSILVENGETFSGQNYFYLNEHLKQIASEFPTLNFYCAAKPATSAANIVDCSELNLIELSRLGDKCAGFLMKGSAVNAATQTDANRYKPRCIVGWDLPIKVWSNEDNPVVYAEKYAELQNFLQQFIEGKNQVNNEEIGGYLSSEIREQEKIGSKPSLLYYQTPIGNYYLPADATYNVIHNHIKAGLVFEGEVLETAHKYITRNSTVLDIGANFGQMSLLFSQFVGKEGQVYSFEADDYVFSILKKNIAANKCRNIQAYNKTVYDKTGSLMFYPVPDFQRFGSYPIAPNRTEARTVETITIDSLNIQTPISFMKVDVQGSDLFVMRGAIETIKQHKMPIIFEFEEQFQDEFKTSFQDYINLIELIGYKVAETINKINFLIVPDDRTIFATTGTPFPSNYSRLEKQLNKQFSTGEEVSIPPTFCKFLKSKGEIYACTEYLHKKGYVSHNVVCKDWDLAHIIHDLSDGNFLDMGSSDSYILKNAVLKNIKGEKYGIDLQPPDVPVEGVKYIIGDLMNTGLPSNYFSNITCLSVIEHQVDFEKFAAEVSRILSFGGKLYLTFDYWNPKVTPAVKLYDLSWNILDETAVKILIEECEKKNLYLVEEIDWSLGEAIIRKGYYSPDPTVSYTFGMLVFQKKL